MLPFTRPRTSSASAATTPTRVGTPSSATGAKKSSFKDFFTGGGGGGGATTTAAGAPGLVPGKLMAPVLLPTVQGGHVLVGAPTGAWQLILITRGKACPVSRNYLAAVEAALPDLDSLGVEVLALTADPRDQAEAFATDVAAAAGGSELGMKVVYGLPPDQAGAWGCYLSEWPQAGGGGGGAYGYAASPQPAVVHPEPAVILLTPDGVVSLVLKSSSAFGWPDLRILVEGLRFSQEHAVPIFGTAGLEE